MEHICYDVSHLHRLGNKSSRQRDQLSRMSVQLEHTVARFPSDEGYDHTDDRVVVFEQGHYETAGVAPIKNELRSKMTRSRNVASDNGITVTGLHDMIYRMQPVTGECSR